MENKRPGKNNPKKRDERPKNKDRRDGKPFRKDEKPANAGTKKTWSNDDKPAGQTEKKPWQKDAKPGGAKPPFKKEFGKKERSETGWWGGEKATPRKKLIAKPENIKNDDGLIRLNKFISNAGVCSRREADELIKVGVIMVNGKIVTEVGTKVSIDDKVQYGKETLRAEKLAYILLNKPKDFITTMDDPEKRRTVMDLLKGLDKKVRVYPVGRLDRNTTGVLLLTNDGELTQKLIHPKHLVKKIYHVELNRPIDMEDFHKISEGLTLDDGFIKPDEVAYVNKENKKEIGIEIHSGKNRIVRRIFEHLDYQVVRLDRVYFAGLTKKDLPRGTWRELNENEIRFLKMLG